MKKILLVLIALSVITFLVYQQVSSTDQQKKKWELFWEDRHDFFKNSQASPFVQKGADYEEVPVFPFDASLRVNASLDRYETRKIVTLGNSDGTSTKYLKYARANFTILEIDQTLVILKTLGFGAQYLTAFGDETSGVSTYGGGRYLDLELGKSDRIEIDFNKAYNPYCAYFEDFTCPLPPLENLLTVPIKAGERVKTESGD
ncbi:MAG: DUF1684 domain-containing protein [Bacteroidota bacterium]